MHQRKRIPLFRYKRIWSTNEGFKDFVKSHWETIGYSPDLMVMLDMKIRQIKQSMRWWNRNVFGDVVNRAREAEERVIR